MTEELKPFLYALMRPNGKPEISEECVAEQEFMLGEVANDLNCTIVPLYTRAEPARKVTDTQSNQYLLEALQLLVSARPRIARYNLSALGKATYGDGTDSPDLHSKIDAFIAALKAAGVEVE